MKRDLFGKFGAWLSKNEDLSYLKILIRLRPLFRASSFSLISTNFLIWFPVDSRSLPEVGMCVGTISMGQLESLLPGGRREAENSKSRQRQRRQQDEGT